MKDSCTILSQAVYGEIYGRLKVNHFEIENNIFELSSELKRVPWMCLAAAFRWMITSYLWLMIKVIGRIFSVNCGSAANVHTKINIVP